MGLQLHPITSIKLSNNSKLVENFHSDTPHTIGDIVNILGVDYQIETIDGDKLTFTRPYEYIGELVPEKIKLKIIPDKLKSQVKLFGELRLVTVEDLVIPEYKSIGLVTPGWWYVYQYPNSVGVELLSTVVTHDVIAPVIEEVIAPKIKSTKKESSV